MTIDEIENILLVLSEKENDEQAATTAFTMLYKGYSKFLNAIVSHALKNMGLYDDHIRDTVVNNTFLKLYEDPLIFSFPEVATDDKGFKAWLSVVAKNDLKRCLMENRNGSVIYMEAVDDEILTASEEISEEVAMSANCKVVSAALDTLPERDRYILTTLYMHYEEGKKTPSNVLDMLCELYETTRPNIRKIKERSEKKVAEYVSKNTELKPLRHVK